MSAEKFCPSGCTCKAQYSAKLDLDNLGYLLVALFMLAWLVSLTVWKTMKLEKRSDFAG
ncbi:hypothetical protein [Paenibacillus sp. R14(2021)]|uniref:hypothetical protein n=1 Tax=Paenibacillus sp. R14(2021) TaxID=2859228 RepID=UPI001C6147B5|nr:hypothetical protein [Paenibacillus sp. R14(2021)]